METYNSEDVINRVKEILGVKSNKDLAIKMNIPQTTISNWKIRNTLPFDIFIKIAVENNISLDWLFLGEEKNNLSIDEKLILDGYRQKNQNEKLKLMAIMVGFSDYQENISDSSYVSLNNQKGIVQQGIDNIIENNNIHKKGNK